MNKNNGTTIENFFELPMFLTDKQAKDQGFDTPELIPKSSKCEFCTKELRPTGRRSLFKPKIVEWTGNHEFCGCEKSVQLREEKEKAHRKSEEAQELAVQRVERQKKVEKLFSECKLGERFKRRTFETYEVIEKNKKVFEKAQRYCEKFDELRINGVGLMFTGSFGTGKTHLAAAITNRLIHKGIPVIFGSLTSLLSKFKDSYQGEIKQSESAIIDLYSNVDLLIIDDLGKEKISDWVLGKLFEIINNRYENDRPVVITSNYSLDELKNRLSTEKNTDTAGAIASRLCEMTQGLECNWEDYRQK